MIRIVVRVSDAGHFVNGGAPSASVYFKTFDVNLPELEAFLRDTPTYYAKDVMGIELLPERKTP